MIDLGQPSSDVLSYLSVPIVFRFILVLAVAIGTGITAIAEQDPSGTSSPSYCQPQFFRWADDCRHIANSKRTGVERLRFAPLTQTGDSWLSFGAQSRLRVERLDAINFGLGALPETQSIAHRLLIHGDLRTAKGPRAFLQLSHAQESGRTPGPRPFDDSEIDIAQAFIGVPVSIADRKINLRLGRQELPLNSKLFGVRDGVILRRAFDAVRVDANLNQNWSAIVAYGSPVSAERGHFDDQRTSGEDVFAFELTKATQNGRVTGYVFNRRRSRGVYLSGIGSERRTMIGGHWVHSDKQIDASIEAGYQYGSVGELDVSAWGLLVELGWRPSHYDMTRFGLNLSIASGDDDPNDGTLNSFDPLYPNLSVFTDAPLHYPTNQIAVGFDVQHQYRPHLQLIANAVAIGREDTSDAVYLLPGRPFTPANSNTHLSSVFLEVEARWRLTDSTVLDASLVRAFPMGDIESNGGTTTDYAKFEITITY